ncbi:MAG TPA: hypothetical protein VF615_10565 [Longimicrobiaceae bacterium]|jgi:predicted transcriptional regulator
MADQTMSIRLDRELARRTRDVAERQCRSQNAVISSALYLYTSLSPAARQVLEEVSQQADLTEIADQIERALVRARWNRMAKQVDPALAEHLAGLSDEELMGLANEAVDETRRSRAGRR